jgi:methylmalonyl-CoA mutase N-terminal domain/subunit
MYRGRLWTMRQYAGFGTAAETNTRFRQLLEAGQTGLSVAFDLPTQMGIDSDSPRAAGEVGRVGVAIDTVDDMHTLLDGIPLDSVSTSMTINATAATLLAMYIVVAEERGFARATLSGTIQNDILKEYLARGTYIYPPGPSLKLITDTFSFCAKEVPQWNPISISGYHIREAGATAVQELAFTLANTIEYVRGAIHSGLAVDEFAPRLSFFFAAHTDLFEEAAKFRAARRMYARLMRETFGANDASCRLRFHTQTGGVTLTAQSPLNNVVRVTIQALAATLGGTQSLHTNGYDEALSLPTREAATLALRTQQLIAYESGIANTVDPLAGSYFVEWLTAELENRARVMNRVENSAAPPDIESVLTTRSHVFYATRCGWNQATQRLWASIDSLTQGNRLTCLDRITAGSKRTRSRGWPLVRRSVITQRLPSRSRPFARPRVPIGTTLKVTRSRPSCRRSSALCARARAWVRSPTRFVRNGAPSFPRDT